MFDLLEKLPVRGGGDANSTRTNPKIRQYTFFYVNLAFPTLNRSGQCELESMSNL